MLAVALGVFLVNGVLLLLPSWLGMGFGNYNWAGKLLSIAVLWTAVLTLPALAPARAFLHRPSVGWIAPTVICTAFLAGATFALNLYFGNTSAWSFETIAYQATLPGFEEELVFRAILLGLFAAAMAPKRCRPTRDSAPPPSDRRAELFAAIISSLLFGLAHGFFLDDAFRPQFDATSFAYTGAIGVGLAWLALHTRSIWPAIFTHNVVNLVAAAARILNA
ncbi:MAG: lysostaphin resistance A-like protein [Thermaurantiacus sp.]